MSRKKAALRPARFVHFCTFAAERNRSFALLTHARQVGGVCVSKSEKHYHARQAAVGLLKRAKTTSDPNVAAGPKNPVSDTFAGRKTQEPFPDRDDSLMAWLTSKELEPLKK